MPEEIYPVELTAPDIAPYRKGNIGIDFVTSFDSGKPGPHVMINAITHGNEVCGAIALDYLFRANVRPTHGKLTLGFVNHLAYSNFDPDNPQTSWRSHRNLLFQQWLWFCYQRVSLLSEDIDNA